MEQKKLEEAKEAFNSLVGGTEDWWCLHKPKFCQYCGAQMDEVSDERKEENA